MRKILFLVLMAIVGSLSAADKSPWCDTVPEQKRLVSPEQQLYDLCNHPQTTADDVASLVVDIGANVWCVGLENWTKIFFAHEVSSEGCDALGAWIARVGYKESLLHAAARCDNIAVFKFLQLNGADVNAKNHEDKTPEDVAPDDGQVRNFLATSVISY